MKTVKTFGTFKKFLKPFAVLFTAGLLISFLYSCEIGLGGAVDTQPPKITITNPPVDAVIRDNFAICGTYDDDGTIASVSAVLTRPDGKGSAIEIKEFTLAPDDTAKGAGTWKINVNALDDQNNKLLADGTYQASITIKDAAGRSTLQNTTFTVDNTAPLLILQRPATDISVINEDDIDTFGKTFTLEGRAADDNNIDHIDIKIFTDPQKTDLIHTVTLQNVPLSIALDVAKWGEENQNYEKIYGSSTQEGAKKRYCSIEAYDSAQRYPADGTEQTAEDKNGNRTNDYYLYNDIAGSSIANYKVTDLYSIMSGNYTSDGRSATDTISSVKAVLNSLKKDSGCFKLNPLNNPTYKLSGWTSTEDFITFEDSSITIDVEPGLDGIAVDKTTLKPYLIKIDDSGNPVSGKIYPDSEDVKITGASSYKIAVKINRKKAKNAAGNDITYTYGTYLVGVEGFDKSEGTPNELMPDNLPIGSQGYKIDIQNVGAAPDLTVNYKVNGAAATGNIIYLPKNKIDTEEESVIELTCTVKDTKEEVPEFQIMLDETSLGVTKDDLVKDNENSTIDSFVYTYTKTIKFSEITGFDTTNSKQHTITVTTTNGSPTSDRKTFMYDVNGPVVEIRNVTPIALKYNLVTGVAESTKYLNGENLEISVSFTDAFDVVDTSTRKPKIEFVQGSTVKTIAANITELSYKTTNVSTKMTGLTDGTVIIRVTAYDRAGNKTVKEEEYEIDQSTDFPVIITGENSVTNTWSDISTKTAGRKNVFNLGGQFLLKFIDDDGLSKYSVYSVKTTTGTESKPDEADAGFEDITINGNESQFAWTLPTIAGFYKVWIDVTDTVGKTKSVGGDNGFFIQVASGVPVVSLENEKYVTTVTDANVLTENASKNPLAVTISIESTEGPFTIKRAQITNDKPDPQITDATNIYIKQTQNSDTLTELTTAVSENEITDYIQIPANQADGEYKVKYFVTDSNNNTGIKIATYKLDKSAPNITSIKLGETALDENEWYESDTMDLFIEVNDGSNEARSDISTVEYSLDNTNWTALTKRGNAYTRTVTFANGINNLYIRAKDNVGNITKQNKTLKIDITAPDFTINHTGDYIYINRGKANQPLELSGTFKDDQSGVNELTLTINGQEVTATNNDGNWTATFTAAQLALAFPKNAQGKIINTTQPLEISGTNKCGTEILSSTKPNITVMMDIDYPEFENISVNSATGKGVYKNSDYSYFVSSTLGTSFTLTGIAKDAGNGSGVKEVRCSVNNGAQQTSSSAGWTFNIGFPTAHGTVAMVTIQVEDNAGNKLQNSITINVDNNAPVGQHKVDAKKKDIIFRIGNNDNDDIDENSTNPQWSDNLDKDVGGKYSDGTYGNAETIKLRGFFEDSGSGVDLIYYKVFKTQPNDDNQLAQKFLKDGNKTFETQADGYFSLITPVEKRVFYTKTNNGVTTDWGGTQLGSSSKWYIDDVKYNFYTTISGLSSGENYLVFVAVDKVGNAAIEEVTVPGEGTFNNYKINVDQVPPTVPNEKIYTSTSFYNPDNDDDNNTFVVYGIANDTAAGIREASVKINGTELTGVYNKNTKITTLKSGNTEVGTLQLMTAVPDDAPDAAKTKYNSETFSDNNKLWKIELNQSAFAGLTNGSSASISLKVIDNAGAGNSETYPVANVMIDKEGPVVTINSPDDGSTVNGIVRISVTANDKTGAGVSTDVPVLYKKNGSNWDNLSIDPVQNEGAWIFTVDTTTKFTDNTDVTLRVSFDDVVGNTGYSDDEYSLTVNQDTDRPIIKMNQVKSDGSGYLTSKTVFGSVTDDDGTINKLWVWSTKLAAENAEPTTAPSYSNDTWTVPDGWIEFGKDGTKSTLENNNWQIDSTEPDGDTKWFWAVADADNMVFWTKNASSLKQPYITYSDVAKQSNTSGIPFKYDTESPEINSVELLRLATNTYKTGTTPYAASEIAGYVADLGLEWSSANNMVFGKDYALMYAKVEVTEKTGMDSTTPLALDYITLGANDVYVTEPDSNNKYTYYLGPFDLHSNDTASPTLTITAKDAAGKTSSKEKAIVVDNIAEITISDVSPAADEIASGKFTLRGQVSDAQSSVTKVEYYIPKYSESTDTTVNTLATKSFTHITTATSIQFAIDFNNFNSDILKYTTNGTEVSVDSNFAGYDIGDNVYQIPVWFKVTDSVGNIGYVTDIQITYDPNEDRPKVYITDPEISTTPVEKGGRIKISGNAQDNEGIAAVYLQFDLDGNNTDNWTNSSTTGAVLIPGTTDVYGFKATNTKNWNYTLDVSSGITDETVIKVRAIAQDNDTGLLSAWTDVLKIKVNNSIPYLDGDMYLRQYSGNTVTVEKKYEPNMYVKGAWKLEGTISTPSSDYLSSMTITVNNGETKSSTWNRTGAGAGAFENSNNAAGVTISYKAGSNDKSMNFSIPVSGSAKCEITIETTDNAPHTGTEKPEINIDNTPASFADYSDQANHKILLYQDSYGAGGTLLGSSNYVQNSNGAQFTLAGKIVEEQSGFDKAVFYFKRTGSDGVVRVYNPMEGHGTDNQANRTNIASGNSKANAIAGTGGTIYIHTDDQLPVRPLTVVRGTTETAQNDEIKTNKNIRVGGLVYIGGLYRLITNVNRTTGTITFEPEAATSNTDAEFVYGLVVDHNGERDNGAGGVDFDDGDGLLESYSGSTTANFRWEATFNSANIPDGPIDIYVVTFDKAGNIGYGYLTTKASNNAPRITKVMLGTDLNGNNTFDYGTDEFTTFYAFTDKNGEANTTKGNAAWTLDTSAQLNSGKYWTAKNGLAVIPEFVGGAGPFYYVFDKGVVGEGQELKDKIKTTPSTFTYSNASSHILLASGANDKIKYNGANATWTYGTSTSGDNTGGSVTLTNNNLVTTTGEYSKSNDTETNPAVVYTFTFWDSTEESTPGTDTGSTILNAYVRQDLTDDVVPNTVIKPFEWTGTGYTKNVSTVVNGGQPSVVADNIDALGVNDKLGITKVINGTTITTTTITPKNNLYGASKENGHIELEADLTAAVKTATVNSTALGDDPKVSGKITFHGTSYDNTRLSSIWFKFDNFTADGGISSGGDTGKTGTNGYTQAAYYNTATATWVPATATMADNNWEFTVTDNYFNQTGHKVDWYLSIDTSKITNVAGLDKVLTVITLDSSGKVSTTTTSSSTDDTVNNVPTYQMDVVPYITKLYTGISDTAGEEFARSATGKYVVRAAETVKMYGFNLKAGNNAAKIGTSNVTPTTGDTDSLGSYLNFPIGNNSSGAVSITVNGVQNLNNLNKNPEFTSATNDTITAVEYNSQADGVTNNRLTDDVELWVWTTSAFDNKVNTTDITSPMMKMDNSGNYYISYGRGPITFAIDKNGTSNDLEICYNKYHNTNVAFDSSGNFYGVGTNTDRAGDDINTQSSFTFFSRDVGNALYKNNNINANDSFITSGASRAHYTTGSNKRRLELSQYGTGAYNINRVQRPKLTISGDDSAAKVFMAYYDASAANVKFRYGVVSDTETLTYRNGKYNRNSKMTLGLANDLTGNAINTSSASGYHLIADSDDETKFKAGAYTAVGYTTDGEAVVAWYDAKARRLVYSYNDTPETAVTSMTNNTWQTNAVYLDGAYTGWYVDLVVDAGNHVHIAYYNSKSGDLKYVYIPTYNEVSKDANGNLTGGATVVTVDSYLSVGTNITINVRDEGTGTGNAHVAKYVPYIYYYNTSNNQTMNSVKVAWQKETTLRDGAINDKFTGAWESMTIPTQNIPVDATVCGGVPTGTHDGGTDYSNTVVLGYMTDVYYEKAYIKGNIK